MEQNQIDWNLAGKELVHSDGNENIYEVYGKAGRREYRGTAVYVNGDLLEILDIQLA